MPNSESSASEPIPSSKAFTGIRAEDGQQDVAQNAELVESRREQPEVHAPSQAGEPSKVAPTAQQILNVFRAELGTVENPRGSNQTPYGVWYGWNGVPWCMIFQSWAFDQRQALPLIGGKFAYTPAAAAWFESVGRWSATPQVGSLAFFDFPDDVDRIQHVEIVEEVRADGRIVTIGGNTSSDTEGSQDNGGGVYRRVRSTVHVVGYGHPDYSTESSNDPDQDLRVEAA
jgi:CHAP domain-containing protein